MVHLVSMCFDCNVLVVSFLVDTAQFVKVVAWSAETADAGAFYPTLRRHEDVNCALQSTAADPRRDGGL